MEKNLFELLRAKDIIAILDGDTTFGEYEFEDSGRVPIGLPYQSGRALCDISTCFGLQKTYSWGGGAQSRWVYVDELLEHCVNSSRCSDLLAFLFSKGQFEKLLNGHSVDEIEKAYSFIIGEVLKQINRKLYFSGHKLDIAGSRFVIYPIDSKVSVDAPTVKNIDREYIKGLSERAMFDVEQKNYDSAITKARTIVEETFCYVIEKKNVSPATSGDIGALYKQVKDLYNMHGDPDTDKRINMLLSGLEKIVSSISEMRNKGSDAHGVGAKRISIEEHHARLFVNASVTMADFVLSVANRMDDGWKAKMPNRNSGSNCL